MSLAERSDGILETYVQWEDIEQDMQKALGTTVTFGPNKTVKNIGEGRGFVSRISLINPDWQNGREDLPKHFIVKICSALTAIDFGEKREDKLDVSFLVNKILEVCFSIHNGEVDTYRILNKYNEGRVPLPKIYATRKFSEENKTKGYIIMEYFDDLVSCHITDNIDVDSIKKALRSIAVWQSIGLKFTEEERNVFSSTFLGDNVHDMFTETMIEQCRTGFLKLLGPKHSNLIEQYIGIMRSYCTKENFQKIDGYPDKLGCKRVFNHGDMWSNNILWAKTENGYDLRAHIDFQTANFNGPALDISRCLAACLSGSDRRKHFKELLSTFYDYLREEVEGELPYTLEQLELSYKSVTPLSACLVISLADQIFDHIKKESPHAADQIKETLLEKLIALMEDVIDCYQSLSLE